MFKKILQNLLRKKPRFFLTPVLIVAIFFILYQLIIFTQLTKQGKVETEENHDLIRGIHLRQKSFYETNENHQFTCIHSMEKISFSQVNDDYCDCLDGSDEPGTNACPNGIFYCSNQISYKKFHKSVPSSRVNDGICDCCDGSDEWKQINLPFNLNRKLQKDLSRYLAPCPNLCTS